MTDGSGAVLRGGRVVLRDGVGKALWRATCGKDGAAYLFYRDGKSPASVAVPDARAEQALSAGRAGKQGSAVAQSADDVTLAIGKPTPALSGDMQVMFLVERQALCPTRSPICKLTFPRSPSSRDTELFGRALAICTGATCVFLTDDSGIGDSHFEPIVDDYTVESLHDTIVCMIRDVR